jgi:alpha-tubulin suppressor-like RCC1 family protein
MSKALTNKKIVQVSCGPYHTLALTDDNMIFGMGHNFYYQLGDGTNTNSNLPVAADMSGVLKDKIITRIAGGMYHSVVATTDSRLYTW